MGMGQKLRLAKMTKQRTWWCLLYVACSMNIVTYHNHYTGWCPPVPNSFMIPSYPIYINLHLCVSYGKHCYPNVNHVKLNWPKWGKISNVPIFRMVTIPLNPIKYHFIKYHFMGSRSSEPPWGFHHHLTKGCHRVVLLGHFTGEFTAKWWRCWNGSKDLMGFSWLKFAHLDWCCQTCIDERKMMD